jgi:hypothetical protein
MRALLLTAALAALAAAPAGAQMLPSGTWAGTLADADGDRQPVEATVERCATGMRVALLAGGRTAETETGTWEGGRLRFRLDRVRVPGTRDARPLACSLEQQEDGALAGPCRSGRAAYRMRLVPPADAAFGCD